VNPYEEYTTAIGTRPQMVGVVARSAADVRRRAAPAVVLLGAGLVHHVGPNRLIVHLARRLAARGLASVRFDHRGIGDSAPRLDGKPFEVSAVEEAREVMDHLEMREGVHHFVLLGICSGAETALAAAREDPRVVGVGMVNGGGQGAGAAWDAYEYSRSQVRYYLREAVFNLDSWRRALTGRIRYRLLITALVRRVRDRLARPAAVESAARQTSRDIEALAGRGVHFLWAHSERDFSRDYFDTMFGKDAKNLFASGRVRREIIPFVDHTFTARHAQARFLEVVERWLEELTQLENVLPAGAAAITMDRR